MRATFGDRSGCPGVLSVGRLSVDMAPDGKQLILTVPEVNDETVMLEGNHPLAGQDVAFDIELVEIAIAQLYQGSLILTSFMCLSA